MCTLKIRESLEGETYLHLEQRRRSHIGRLDLHGTIGHDRLVHRLEQVDGSHAALTNLRIDPPLVEEGGADADVVGGRAVMVLMMAGRRMRHRVQSGEQGGGLVKSSGE